MPAYPFSTERDFTAKIRHLRWVTRGKGLAVVIVVSSLLLGLLTGPAGWFIATLVKQSFRRSPMQPWRLPKRLIIAGIALTLVTLAPYTALHFGYKMLVDFGDKATGSPATDFLIYAAVGIGPALIVGGLLGGMMSAEYNYATQSFLNKNQPTRAQRKLAEKNTDLIKTGEHHPEKTVQFGVVVDDDMAWRQPRHGMIVERPAHMLQHGVIVGTNGSGKTWATVNIVHGVLRADAGVLYIDNKDADDTCELMTKAAVKAGHNVVSLSMSDRNNATWMDPLLDPEFTPMEKASMVYQSLNFDDQGNAAFYADTARVWLQHQFVALDKIGLNPGEGTFDFLLRTSMPTGLLEAIEESGNIDADWAKPIVGYVRSDIKRHASELRNLHGQIETTVNGAGHLLRSNGTPMLDLRAAERDGTVVYVGLSGTADQKTMKLLGSLVLRYISLLVSRRLSNRDTIKRDVYVFVDEAGFLEEKGDAFEGLFKQARAARYWVWPASQSLADFPESSATAIMANASTRVILRLNEAITAKLMSDATPPMWTIDASTDSTTTVDALGQRSISSSGGVRRTVASREHMLSPGDFIRLPNHRAYVMFALSDSNNPGSNKHDSVVMDKWVPAHPIGRGKFTDENSGDAPVVALVPLDLPSDDEVRAALNPTLNHTFTEYVASGQQHADESASAGVRVVSGSDVVPVGGAGGGGFDPGVLVLPGELAESSSGRVGDSVVPVSGAVGGGVRAASAEELAALRARSEGEGVSSGEARGGRSVSFGVRDEDAPVDEGLVPPDDGGVPDFMAGPVPSFGVDASAVESVSAPVSTFGVTGSGSGAGSQGLSAERARELAARARAVREAGAAGRVPPNPGASSGFDGDDEFE